MTSTTIDLHERVFEYDVDERTAWCGADAATRDAILAVTGDLGRDHDTYDHQAGQGQNYPEVRYAMHLITSDGFPKTGVLYENFLVCASVMPPPLKSSKAPRGLKHLNTQATLSKIFAPRFFVEMDRIFDAHFAEVGSRDRRKLHVDLCAVDFTSRRCRFVELKRFDPGRAKHEGYDAAQLLCLAAIRYAVASLGARAFLGEPYAVETELVVFVPVGVTYKPVTHRVELSV